MSLPAFVLSIVLASLYAGGFHFAFAKKASDIGYYWLAALAGFFVGALLGLLLPRNPFVIGEVHVFEATLTCAGALFLARWLRTK